MDPQTKEVFFHMYRDYKRELWTYTGENYEANLKEWFEDMFSDPSMTIRLIGEPSRNILIGFFVVQELNKEQTVECRCSWFISESYIVPQYRNKGFMSAIVHEFTSQNTGNIGLVTINNNVKAMKFWDNTLGRLGYQKEYVPQLSNKTESFYKFEAPLLMGR